MLMCVYIQKMELDKDVSTDMYLFPPLKFATSIAEYVAVPGKPISYSSALKYYESMLNDAGLNCKLFGLHSPRIGATADAFKEKVPEHVIDKRGRWKSSNSKFGYLRKNEDYCILLIA
jgi:hypothetical protein